MLLLIRKWILRKMVMILKGRKKKIRKRKIPRKKVQEEITKDQILKQVLSQNNPKNPDPDPRIKKDLQESTKATGINDFFIKLISVIYKFQKFLNKKNAKDKKIW